MNRYTIHLLALPNVQTTMAYSLCGFCVATIRFAKLLKELGHEVILYASEQNEAPCDELVTVVTADEQAALLDNVPYQYAEIKDTHPLWKLFNARAIKEIRERKKPRDFICSIGGVSQQPIAAAHPTLMFVEYSVGYSGCFSPYRVYESEAWRHHTYGAQQISDGRFFDDVIPCFYDEVEFPFQSNKEPFALFVGRLTPRKGIEIACRTAQEAKIPLKVIGHGDASLVTRGAEYLGALNEGERNQWMARASMVLQPTHYVEPFNQVAVEAQLCGTPVIATPWGGFSESVEPGRTGFLCHYLREFVEAVRGCRSLDSLYIRQRAVQKYSVRNVAPRYQRYFDRLSLLWGDGFYSL